MFFRGNSVSNYGSADGSGNVEFISGEDFDVAGNVVTGNAGYCLFFNNLSPHNSMTKIRIHNNKCDGGILVYNSRSDAELSDVIITDNFMTAGLYGSTQYCLAVQRLSGEAIKGLNVVGNRCHTVTPGAEGGYSIAGVEAFALVGNGFAADAPFTIDAFEIVSSADGTISGNTAVLKGNGSGFVCNVCQRVVFAANLVDGFSPDIYGYAFAALNSVKGAMLDSVSFVGNTAIFPPKGIGRAFWVVNNNPTAITKSVAITGNTTVSDGSSVSAALIVENDSGTLRGILDGPNSWIGTYQGSVYTEKIEDLCHIPGLNTATRPLINRGAVISCK